MKFRKKAIVMFFLFLTTLFFAGCGGSVGGSDDSNPPPPTPDPDPTPPAYKTYGLDFSPYMDGQNPNYGSFISADQIRERLGIIKSHTEWIRTFGSTSGIEETGKIAHELGLKAAVGAWLGNNLNANETEIANLIQAGQNGHVDIAIVGSETLLRGDLSEDQLIGYINRVKSALPGVTVTTGEVYGELLAHPNVVAACDVIFVNYYSYWEGKSIDKAVVYLNSLHQKVLAISGGKEIIVSETGWPSCGNVIGDAIPSPENASYYFLNFVSWAREKNVKYFYFEAFDEGWKAGYEGPQGACWGIWNKDGIMKPGMQDVFDGKTVPSNWDCGGIPGGEGNPKIEFTKIPAYGSSENLQGQVWHVDPIEYKVVVYINVGGGWWIKPYYDEPKTSIDCDGSWTTDVTTGGIDETATEFAAYLIPAGYDPPLSRDVAELELNAVDWTSATR